MAIASITVKQSYVANGTNDTFAIPFVPVVSDSAEVVVYVRDESTNPDTVTLQVEGALQDYVLDGAVLPTDFDTDVVFNAGKIPANGKIVTIISSIPYTQTLDLSNNGNLNLEVLELTLDRIVRMVQQLNERFSRVPLLGVTEQVSADLVLPDPAGESVVGWNTAATQLRNWTFAEILQEVAAAEGALLIGNNLSDLANPTTALINLGLTATAAEINYTSDVTSLIQAQLNAKASTAALATVISDLDTAEAAIVAALGDIVDLELALPAGDDYLQLQETVSPPATPAAGKKRIYADTDGSLYQVNSAGVVSPLGGGAGGGVKVVWNSGPNAPIRMMYAEREVFAFEPGLAQELNCNISLPSSYIAGSQIGVKIGVFSPGVTGTMLMKIQATLTNIGDDIGSTTNQATSTNTAVDLAGGALAGKRQEVNCVLSTNGLINAVAVQPRADLNLRIYRDTDTETADVYLIIDSEEVYLS